MPKPIIAFTGFAGAGKTTAAQYLGRGQPVGSTIILSFADRLRSVVKLAMPYLPVETFHAKKNDDLANEGLEGLSGRKILQQIGTEGFRALDPDVWVKALEYEVKQRLDMNPKIQIFVDDVRFPNEAAMLQRYGHVYRIDRARTIDAGVHESEAHVMNLPVKGVINNHGTMEEFEENIRHAMTMRVLR